MLRNKPDVGDGSGLYVDYASGVHAYRNIAYNNTGAGFKLSCLWRDGEAVFYNNIAANNLYGFKLTGHGSCDSHNGSLNTQLANNILMSNGAYGIQLESSYESGNFGNLTIDHNLYYANNGSGSAGSVKPADIRILQGAWAGQYFRGLDEIRSGTPWEKNGVEGDPAFLKYDPADHDRFDGSWPDFRLTSSSINALDRGTADLPESLSILLSEFEISDTRVGNAFDIGRFETVGLADAPPPQPPVPVDLTSLPTPQPPAPARCALLPVAAVLSIAPVFRGWHATPY